MLIEIGMDAFYFVSLLIIPGFWIDIGIGATDCTGVSVSGIWQHFFHIRIPARKIASAIRIMVAGEVKVQWAYVVRVLSRCLNNWRQTLHCIYPYALNGQVYRFGVRSAE